MKNIKILLGVLGVMLFTLILLPSNVSAKANFDELLTDGKLVVNSVKPTSNEMAYTVIYEYMLMDKYPDYYLDFENPCNKDFSKCTIYYGNFNSDDVSKEVEVSWVYDEDVKTVVDTLIDRLDGKDTFNLNEIEYINYLLNLSNDSSMINYSSELKKAIDYKNFSIDVRMGDDSTFYTERGGNAVFTYNDTIYYVKAMTLAQAKHILYVNDDTTDVLSAIKEKLVKIFGTDFNVVEKDTIANYLESKRQEFMKNYNPNSPDSVQYTSKEEYAAKMMDLDYYNDDAYYHFITDSNIYEKYYALTINDTQVDFLVVKDSKKVNNDVNLITSDIESDVTISTTSKTIPLDTLISVAKLTKGEEYDKIVKILNATDFEMFDLKLFSKSTGDYITKLSDNTFEVRIPIKDELKDKDLVVYYVDDNNKVIEYKVVVEDGYAKFNTDHFSIYTLAHLQKSNTINNPDTGDNVMLFVLLGAMSLIGIIGVLIHLIKRKNTLG